MHVLSEHQGVTLGSDMQPDGDYRVLLAVMANVFVAIRAADNIKKTAILADIFHNVPARMANHHRAEDIEREIYSRAADFDCERYVDAMFTSVRSASK
ncbi:MAG TPA: hypothetical protein DIC56_03640 [Rhizobium sp.]|nr:hypothetical protein [Rhizobium sp.]